MNKKSILYVKLLTFYILFLNKYYISIISSSSFFTKEIFSIFSSIFWEYISLSYTYIKLPPLVEGSIIVSIKNEYLLASYTIVLFSFSESKYNIFSFVSELNISNSILVLNL